MKIKLSFLTLLSAICMFSCTPKEGQTEEQTNNPEDSVVVTESTETVQLVGQFGAALSDSEQWSADKLKKELSQLDSADMKIAGEIVETCTKKGCWMTVKLATNDTIRVTFREYGFFVPKEGVEGKSVVFEGTAFKKVTDVATLQHFASDAGKSEEEIAKITDPKEEITFTADAVKIN